MLFWRQQSLSDRARQGDREALEELLRHFVEGDPGTRSLVEELFLLGLRATAQERIEVDCSGFAEHADDLLALKESVNRDPRRSQPAVEEALRKPWGSCFRAQVLGLQAHILRALGDPLEAEAALREAKRIAGTCQACALDITRRQAAVAAAAGRLHEAKRLHYGALVGYRALDDAGHDLDRNGVASCLFTRGSFEGAAAVPDHNVAAIHFAAALAAQHPRQTPKLFDRTICNLAIAYSHMKDLEKKKMAFDMLPDVRRRFMGVSERSEPRGKLDWFEGQLRLELRKGKRTYAFELLERSQETFIYLGLIKEAVAVASDTVAAYHMDKDGIRAFLGRTGSDLRAAIQSPQLLHLLDKLDDAVRPKLIAFENVDKATRRLRRAVEGPGIFPRLAIQQH